MSANSAGSSSDGPSVWIGPTWDDEIAGAIEQNGGRAVDALAGADAVVWVDTSPHDFPPLPDSVCWIQLPSAGIEAWLKGGLIDESRDTRVWTSAAGSYGFTVAEHALALTLAGLRRIPEAARATTWTSLSGRELRGATVAVVGAGGIGTVFIDLVAPFGVRVIAVNTSGNPVPGAERTVSTRHLDDVWGEADVVLLSLPHTADTHHIVGAAALSAMRSNALLVNVGRGPLVDTDALVAALHDGAIGGAALDVTDPEPLPDGHPLWSEPRALITPHSANPASALHRELVRRVGDNVARFADNRPLLAPIDPRAGY